MAALKPTSNSSGILSYFNPYNYNLRKVPSAIYGAVAWVFKRKDPGPLASLAGNEVVVLNQKAIPADDGKDGDVVMVGTHRYRGLIDYLDSSVGAYPTKKIILDSGEEVEVAASFLTDIERIGDPDEFYIDLEKITPAPKTDQQKKDLLTKMLGIAKDDKNVLKAWTQTWNYRLKIDLQEMVWKSVLEQQGLQPYFPRNGYASVVTTLHTDTGNLSCVVSGRIDEGADDKMDNQPVNLKYKSKLTFDSQGWIDKTVEFTD